MLRSPESGPPEAPEPPVAGDTTRSQSTWVVHRGVVHWALLLALLLGGIELATRHLAIPWTIDGSSMEPALSAGDRVIVDVWSYRHRRPRVGEIALLEAPRGDAGLLVKRVAAGPGARGGPDRLWVEGDNREQSLDSRTFGPVAAHGFRGRVILRYWPPSRAGRVR